MSHEEIDKDDMPEPDMPKVKRCEGCDMEGEVEEMNMPDGVEDDS